MPVSTARSATDCGQVEGPLQVGDPGKHVARPTRSPRHACREPSNLARSVGQARDKAAFALIQIATVAQVRSLPTSCDPCRRQYAPTLMVLSPMSLAADSRRGPRPGPLRSDF